MARCAGARGTRAASSISRAVGFAGAERPPPARRDGGEGTERESEPRLMDEAHAQVEYRRRRRIGAILRRPMHEPRQNAAADPVNRRCKR